MTYKMFIDDERFPVTDDWVIVRSSQEAIDCVKKNGFPQHINFDHDLGGDDTTRRFVSWIVDRMLDGDYQFPEGFTFDVHSQNPIGAKSIRDAMGGIIWEMS